MGLYPSSQVFCYFFRRVANHRTLATGNAQNSDRGTIERGPSKQRLAQLHILEKSSKSSLRACEVGVM